MFWKSRNKKKVKLIIPEKKNDFGFDRQLCELMQKGALEVACRQMLLSQKMNEAVLGSLNEIRELHYCIGSRFLRMNHEIFCRSEKESVHLITGVENGIIKHLDEALILEHEVKELVTAKVFDSEVNIAMQNLDFDGYRLFGCFHIHPGYGPGATGPSEIDLELITNFETGKYPAVSAIFSRDGYIRFMAPFQFRIHVHGKGVRKINEELFQLVKVS